MTEPTNNPSQWCSFCGQQGHARDDCPRRSESQTRAIKALVIILLIVLVALGLYIGIHTWYVDTHCTTILGTRVCKK
jgi:hypothetical protein